MSGTITGFGEPTVLNVSDYVQSFALSDDLRTVAAVRHVDVFYNWSVYAVDTGRRGADAPLCHHEFDPDGIAFYGDGTRIATISNDGAARIWDVAGGRKLWEHRVDSYKRRLYGLTVAPDGRIAFCDQTGLIHVVRPRIGADDATAEAVSWQAHRGECRGLKFFKDGSGLVSGGWDKKVVAWSDKGTPIRTFDVGAFVNDVDTDARGDYVAATSAEKPELDFETGKKVLAGTYGRVASGNGFVVLAHGTDRPLASWHGNRGPATDAAISPDGRYVAVAGWDFTVRLIELSSRKVIATIATNRHPQMVRFSKDGTRLVVANWTKPMSGGPSLTVYRLAMTNAVIVVPVY
jgi:WD40 repeat protein